MQIHELKPQHKTKRKKRIGFGGKHGTHSGRGIHGQTSRPSHRLKPIIRELIKRYPKLRGHRGTFKTQYLKTRAVTVDLEILEKKFKSEEKVTQKTLLEKGIITKIKGEFPSIKILGKSKMTKALIIEGLSLSKKAKEEIERAGGKVI